MTILDVIIDRCAAKARFETPAPCAASTAAVRVPAAEPDAVTVGLPPAATEPGRGWHANDCAYLDFPGHRCVDAAGQPSNRMCIATYYRATRLAGTEGGAAR